MFEQLSIYNYFNCARIFLKKEFFSLGIISLNQTLIPFILASRLFIYHVTTRIMTIYNIKINIGSAMKLDHWFILKGY